MIGSSEKLWLRTQRYLSLGQTAPARVTLESLLAKNPAHAQAHLLLGGLEWADDNVRLASRHALAACEGMDSESDLALSVANALVQTGETAAAHALLAQLKTQDVVEPTRLLQLAALHQNIEEHAESLDCHERARALGANDPYCRFLRAFQLAFNGRLGEAEAEFEFCIAAGLKHGRAYIEAARLRPATPQQNYLAQINRQIAVAEPDGEDRAALEFARYKELEDLQHYDEAWESLARANELMAKRVPCDTAHSERLLGRLLDLCNQEFLRPVESANEGPQPIFIIGMPRSGTTLLDRLLGAHPEVQSTGELRDFGQQMRWMADHAGLLAPDEVTLARLPGMDFAALGQRYLAQTRWRAANRRYFTDKLTANWVVAGLIAKTLPRAPIINLVRDPMDVCFSNFRAFFSDGYPWTYSLETLAAHYRQYSAAMRHWHTVLPGRILDVSYAALVRNPEETMRHVLMYCGLDWDPVCLDTAHNRASIATLSFSQAREAPHLRSFGSWRSYAAQLEPLQSALATTADAA